MHGVNDLEQVCDVCVIVLNMQYVVFTKTEICLCVLTTDGVNI